MPKIIENLRDQLLQEARKQIAERGYTGTTVRIGTVAVDPRVIPYGTRMFIVSNDGCYVYGLSVAEDCGGAIKGKRLDLYMPTLSEAFDYGRRPVTVYFLGDANKFG